MAEYKSRYTGQQIDAGIAKANTALQEHQSLEGLQETLISGENIKTINGTSILGEGNLVIEGGEGGLSSVAHDNTMTGSGTNADPLGVDTTKFGTYSKPSGGIPESDLSSEVQTKLNSGGGSGTDVQINGTSITSSGVANLRTETAYDSSINPLATMSDVPDVSNKQETLVSGTNIKTINGTSLLGEGDITISSVGVDKFLNNAELVASGEPTTEEKTILFSPLDTANSNFSLLSNNRSFWTTYDDYMKSIHNNRLEEITLNANTAGTVRIYGYDTAIAYEQTLDQLANAASRADSSGYLIMTITVETGIKTYKLDGTDSRVVIAKQTAIDSCPPCLGFSRTGDTGILKYNGGNITGEPYRHWAHSGLSGTTIDHPDPTNALAVSFKVLKTTTDPNTKLVLTMNDNTKYEVVLGTIDISPIYRSVYSGKTLSILGDSISTYSGQIPSGQPTYYPRGDVSSVENTWWKKLANALGMSILVNNSWSGSMVTTNNGDAGAGCLTRCQALHSGSTDPDVIIVWLGINDFNNEVDLGTYDGKSSVPNTTTTFREAYGMMLNKILTRYKTSEVWVCTLPQMERNNDAGFPEINENGVPLKDYNDAIEELAKAFGVKVLDHNRAGMTYQNMDTYTVDWDSSTSKGLHPNNAGHSLIANNDIRQIDNTIRTRY